MSQRTYHDPLHRGIQLDSDQPAEAMVMAKEAEKKEAAKAAAIKDVAVGDAEEDPAIRELREAATRAAESLESHDDDNDEKGGGLAH